MNTDEVHVWLVDLDGRKDDTADLWELLSSDEQARADRYRFVRDRHRFIAGRGMLRHLLGRYAATDPVALRFQYSAYGKPSLDPDTGLTALNFNLSHSGGLALYAFTLNRAIGIDIEKINPKIDLERIANRFFSPLEVQGLKQFPAQEQVRAFFHCWTRKEAFIKARGQGLSLPLDQFEVSLHPDEPPALLRTQWDETEADLWALRHLDPATGFVGALAVEGHGWKMIYSTSGKTM